MRASVTRPTFEPSATTITRCACSTIARFVRASRSSWVVAPPDALMPSVPRIAVPTLIALKVFSASAPTASNDEERTRPPVMMTCRFGLDAISVAVVSEFVTIVSSERLLSSLATAAVVVPPLRAMA